MNIFEDWWDDVLLRRTNVAKEENYSERSIYMWEI
jgi:hypothetical protein